MNHLTVERCRRLVGAEGDGGQDVLRRLLEEHGDEHAEYLDLPSGSLQIVRRNLMPVDVVQPGWVVDVEGGPGPRGG